MHTVGKHFLGTEVPVLSTSLTGKTKLTNSRLISLVFLGICTLCLHIHFCMFGYTLIRKILSYVKHLKYISTYISTY